MKSIQNKWKQKRCFFIIKKESIDSITLYCFSGTDNITINGYTRPTTAWKIFHPLGESTNYETLGMAYCPYICSPTTVTAGVTHNVTHTHQLLLHTRAQLYQLCTLPLLLGFQYWTRDSCHTHATTTAPILCIHVIPFLQIASIIEPEDELIVCRCKGHSHQHEHEPSLIPSQGVVSKRSACRHLPHSKRW